jgi:acetate CoA/acetoacetate CoA-transferase beta subunit
MPKLIPNFVNAGKIAVGETIGASFFNSAKSFGMIRGGHVDIAILGVLQVGQSGQIANWWAVPGKTIMGVGGAMDLLVGAKIVTTTHTSKNRMEQSSY